VVVLNIGGVVEVASWENKAAAILLTWQPGMEAGNAVADVLSGSVNPSGKLATTFPVQYADVASAKTFPGKEFPKQATTGMMGMKLIPAEVIYEEGIYVGYRYYNSFNVKPAFEFGYGLSYTNFSFTNIKLSSSSFKKQITVTVDITNTGKTPGKEVAQLYLSAPSQKLNKPKEELKGFVKTKLLQPGEKQTLRFTLTTDALASFDTNSTSWIAEAGKYEVKLGSSSIQLKQKAGFILTTTIVVEKCNKVLAPQVAIDELKN